MFMALTEPIHPHTAVFRDYDEALTRGTGENKASGRARHAWLALGQAFLDPVASRAPLMLGRLARSCP